MDRFEPFRGDHYDEGLDGLKLLLLGESHYAQPEDASLTLTQEIVTRYCYERTSAYFTKTRRLVLRALKLEKAHEFDRPWFWDRVAFYNYVPRLVETSSRIRPSEELWALGAEQLGGVLAELEPDVVLVLGKELWGRVEGGSQPVEPATGSVDIKLLRNGRSGRGIPAGMVMHPSAPRWKYEVWVPQAAAILHHGKWLRDDDQGSDQPSEGPSSRLSR